MSAGLAAERIGFRPATTEAATPSRVVDRALPIGLSISAAIVAGVAAGSGPAQIAASIAAFVAALISPATGLVVLAFMAAVKSPPAIPAPGFNTLLVATILLGCIYRLPIDRPRLRPNLPVVLLLAFLLYATVQQVPALVAGYNDTTSHHIGYLFIQLATLTGIALAAALVLRDRSPVPFLVAGLLGALMAAVLAIAVVALPGSAGNLVDYPDATSRPVGPFGDPNYFGLFEATAIAACASLAVVIRQRRIRVLLVGLALVLGIGMLIGLSRAALLALGAGLVALAFSRSRRAGLLAIATLALAAFVVYPLFLVMRLTADAGALPLAQASIGLGRSDASRFAAALVGPQMWATSPILGIGFGEYPLRTARFIGYSIESHNWYMNVLAEQGLVGIALWIPMLATVGLRLLRLGRTPRSVGLAVFVTYLVGSTFLEPPLSVQTSAFAVVAVVAALVGDWRRLPGIPVPAAVTQDPVRQGPEGPQSPSRSVEAPVRAVEPSVRAVEAPVPAVKAPRRRSGRSLLPPARPPVQPLPDVTDRADVEVRPDMVAPGLAQDPAVRFGEAHDPADRPRRQRRLADRGDVPGDTVEDGVATPADVRRNNRKAAGSGLEKDHRQALPPRRHQKSVGGLHEGGDIGPKAEQAD